MKLFTTYSIVNVRLFVGSQKESTEYWNTRTKGHRPIIYSKTSLHPLDRHDEGMKGH